MNSPGWLRNVSLRSQIRAIIANQRSMNGPLHDSAGSCLLPRVTAPRAGRLKNFSDLPITNAETYGQYSGIPTKQFASNPVSSGTNASSEP